MYEEHEKNFIIAREIHVLVYNKCKKDKHSTTTMYYSVDLEMVIMLPRLEAFKNAIFTTRLSAYNETFAPVGQASKSQPIVPVLWHEGTKKGMQATSPALFLKKFVCEFLRDVKSLVLFVDNCSAQNKSWAFFSFLIYAVNSGRTYMDTITINYLEKGHTFMSADSIHAAVEKSMGSKKLYDFQDFSTVVEELRSHVKTKIMLPQDFCGFKDYSSPTYRKKLI